MKIPTERGMTEVHDALCLYRRCLRPHELRGTFVKGRGYISIYRDAEGRPAPLLVCMERHLHDCPYPLPAPDPALAACCAAPSFAARRRRAPPPCWQRCRNCGASVAGTRLAILRGELR